MRSPPVKRGRRRGPSPGFPVWGPEPSRAQLLQGRAAPTQTVDSKLPLALGVCLQGSRQPPEKVPVSRLGKLSGAHAAGRTQFRPSPLLQSTHRFGEPFPVTRPRAGASVWATSFPRRGFPVKARPLTSPESPVQSQSLVSRGGQQPARSASGDGGLVLMPDGALDPTEQPKENA